MATVHNIKLTVITLSDCSKELYNVAITCQCLNEECENTSDTVLINQVS